MMQCLEQAQHHLQAETSHHITVVQKEISTTISHVNPRDLELHLLVVAFDFHYQSIRQGTVFAALKL